MSLCDIQLNVGVDSFTGEGWLSVSCGSSPGDKTAEGQLEGLTGDLRDAVLSLHVCLGLYVCVVVNIVMQFIKYYKSVLLCMGCGSTDVCVYDGQLE